ncbi:MAG: SRPBCC family protein [Pseudomonadota bacterium]
MKILKVLVLGLIGLVVALAVIGLALPRNVHIERSVVIAAQPSTVFTYLNSWKNFNAWSPWAALDPNTKYTYEGPETGVGAKQSWFSEDPNVGNGSQEITAVETDKSITIKLMLPNMEPSIVSQTLAPEGEGTKVVWAMDADMGLSPLNRWFGLLLEKFIGPDYEKGLAKMKPLIEALPKAEPAPMPAAGAAATTDAPQPIPPQP